MVNSAGVERSEQILGGTAVFKGTRVPIETFLEYLGAGERLDDFLEDFRTVAREQALQVLQLAKEALLSYPNETAS